MPSSVHGGPIDTAHVYACRAGQVDSDKWRSARTRIDREHERLIYALRAHLLETGLDLVLRVEPELVDRIVAELLFRIRLFCDTQAEGTEFNPEPGGAFDDMAARAGSEEELRLLVSSVAEAGMAFAVTLFMQPPALVPAGELPALVASAFARYATRLLRLPLPLGATPEGRFSFDVRIADVDEWLRRMESDPERFSRCAGAWARELGGEVLVRPVLVAAQAHQDGVRAMLEAAAAGAERPPVHDGGLPAFEVVLEHAGELRAAGVDPATVYVAAHAGAHEAGLSFLVLPTPLLDPLELSRAIRAVAHARFVDILNARAALA